jgi:hypothetical protein
VSLWEVVRLGISEVFSGRYSLEIKDTDMKKTILILSMIWGLLAVGMSQEPAEQLATIDTIDAIDSTAIIDTLLLPLITEEMTHAVVHQDSLITQLMRDKLSGYVRGEQLLDGFRVQIYASNSQQQAKREATELQQRIEDMIDVPVYTLSEPPFWKVRIGNFSTREAANEYKNTFLQFFPELTGSTYIVPDKIIVIR